jgi:hypothetical protein
MNDQDLEQLKRQVGTEVMGYSIYHYDKDFAENCYYMLMDREYDPVSMRYRENERPTEEAVWLDCPDFTSRLDAVRLMEDEIERRGLQELYSEILHYMCASFSDSFQMARWKVLRATPEQRCRAALRAVKGE